MISVFILPSNHFWNWDMQREELTDVQREKKREKEWLTNSQREKDCAVDRDLAFVPIAISRSTVPIAIAQSVDCDLAKHWLRSREAPRRSQPIVEPSRLSLFFLLSIWPDLMIFFFWVLFVFLYWGMNDIIYLFGNRENVRKRDRIWLDLMIFSLGFVCVSVLRNEWYYIFVWQPRKCDRIWWFFFWVLFVFLYWGMNDILHSFGNRENVSNK